MTRWERLLAWDERALVDRRLMAVESLALFAIFFLLHLLTYSSATWTDADAPFHHLLQAEIHASGWWRDVTWLPHTILGQAGPDHHWLWHLLLSPFSAIDDITTRINVVSAFSFALVPAFTNLALRLLGIRAAPIWIFILTAGSMWSLFRWSMARAQNPACVLMILFIVALARRHKPSLLLLPFVFMHTYHGAALLAVPGGLYFAFDALRHRKADWWLLMLPAAGAVLALLTSPWYPRNIEYFLFHTIDKVGNSLELQVGLEWYGASVISIALGLQAQLAAILVVAIGAGSLLWKRLSPLTLAMIGTLAVFLYMTWSHARFIEYCPQIAVLVAALIVRDCASGFTGKIRPAVLLAIIPAALLITTINTWQIGKFRLDSAISQLSFNQQTGQLLTHFAEPGDLVVNTRWDFFPSLAWYAPGLTYLSGLDPYYLAYGDADRFIGLEKLNGNFADPRKPEVNVRQDLGSNWVITDSTRIAKYLARSGQASVVMSTRDRLVYVVYVGGDPDITRRLQTEEQSWLDVYWPPRQKATP